MYLFVEGEPKFLLVGHSLSFEGTSFVVERAVIVGKCHGVKEVPTVKMCCNDTTGGN